MGILVGERAGVPDVLPDGTDLKPYKRLAAAVLRAALSDAQGSPACAYTTDARWFLSKNSPLLRHWCRLANVNEHRLLNLAKRRRWSKNGQNGRRAQKSKGTSR